jgi:hypothetical protein
VIKFHGVEHSVAGIGSAQLILAARDAVDGDEEPTALGHPLRAAFRVRDGLDEQNAKELCEATFGEWANPRAQRSEDARVRANAKKVGRAVLCTPIDIHQTAPTGVVALP